MMKLHHHCDKGMFRRYKPELGCHTLVKCLPSMGKALDLISSTKKKKKKKREGKVLVYNISFCG
jgi:hypothetical protein